MYGIEQNEARGYFVLKKTQLSVFIPRTSPFEQILNENEHSGSVFDTITDLTILKNIQEIN
jgi:hypothetical protein